MTCQIRVTRPPKAVIRSDDREPRSSLLALRLVGDSHRGRIGDRRATLLLLLLATQH